MCSHDPDCVSFDMHKAYARCWLNKKCERCIGCDGVRYDDGSFAKAKEHDLVTKREILDVHADCTVTVTGAAEFRGTYTKISGESNYPVIFEHPKGMRVVSVPGSKCGWGLEKKVPIIGAEEREDYKQFYRSYTDEKKCDTSFDVNA